MQFTKWEDMSEHEQLLGMYSDMYKDAYGVRPIWPTRYMSVEQLKDAIQALEAIIVEQIEAERD